MYDKAGRVNQMKRKITMIVAALLGFVVCLFVMIGPAAPLWQRLGVRPVCIQGQWPDLKIGACPQPTPAVAVTPLPLPTLEGGAPIPIIVDDDGSPDGMIALLYFLNNPLFDVKAVTISYGEAHPEVFAPQAGQLLAGLGRADIPVGAGMDAPLEGNNAFPVPWRERSDRFWDLDLPPATVVNDPLPAAELIVDTVTQSSQPVVVFVSGAHTNLAQALRLQPGITHNIRDVYVMGGSINVPGNIQISEPSIDNSVAEWNIWVDPLAAHEVFASGLRLHLAPLDSTQQVLWAKDDLTGWKAFRAPGSQIASDLLQMILETWPTEEVYIWDLVTAALATNPALCPETPLAVSILTAAGDQQGRTVVTDGEPNTWVCFDPNAGQVKALAAQILGR
jgi:inosine-uridine nucleoside N-ribohydrolase